MELKSVFVTGVNRGIGLEFLKQLMLLPKPPKFIFGTFIDKFKNQAEELVSKTKSESKVILIKMDVTKMEDIKAAAKIVENTVGEEGLTLLINNAGISVPLPFPRLTPENLNIHFNTNTIGPLMVFQELLPFLKKAANAHPGSKMGASRSAVLNISSMVSSIERNPNLPKEFTDGAKRVVISYRTSKAALNMAMRAAASTVKDDGILVVLMCPGWVKTDMGSDKAPSAPEESVSDILTTLSKMDESHHGLFLDRSGKTMPF